MQRVVARIPSVVQVAGRLSGINVSQARGYSDTMPLTFASPASVYYNNAPVKQIDATLTSGSLGILPNHVPIIGVLQAGVMTITEETKTEKYFVSSGTVTVNDDASVQILAQEAVKLSDLDANECRQGLSEAQQLASTASDEKSKALAQVQVEVFEEIQKVV